MIEETEIYGLESQQKEFVQLETAQIGGASHIELWLVTAYYPDDDDWELDKKTRKGE